MNSPGSHTTAQIKALFGLKDLSDNADFAEILSVSRG